MLSRFLIALPVAVLLVWLSYWSLTARPPQPDDPVARALAEETAGDLRAAERDLLAAARLSQLYEPRWTLAGFYFRHDRTEDFWLWTRRALETGTHDLGALFDLCWQVSSDASLIWKRALPERKAIWNEYLAYLLATHRRDAAAETARKLAAQSTIEDVPLLLGFCDLAIESQNHAEAALVWNDLCRRRLLDSNSIGDGHFLVNGSLARKPLGRGFDWHLASAPGTRVEWTPGQLHITLPGNQSPGAEVLSQPLAVVAGTAYRLVYRFRGSGVRWVLSVNGAPASLSESMTGETERIATFAFSVPADSRAAVLSLRSDAGQSAGSVLLRDLDLVPR